MVLGKVKGLIILSVTYTLTVHRKEDTKGTGLLEVRIVKDPFCLMVVSIRVLFDPTFVLNGT